jgi:hypothetical protein
MKRFSFNELMTFPQRQRPNAFSERRMSPFTASLTSENDRTDVVVKSFDVFHDRVGPRVSFHESIRCVVFKVEGVLENERGVGDSSPGGETQRGRRRRGRQRTRRSDKEERNDYDCLFGTKKETRKSIGKCDRLDRENEFDGDDMMAVGATEEDFMVVRKKRKRRVIPDHERFPEKYVKYSFDEPVVVGGGESGILEKKKRKKEKTDDVDEVRDLGVPQDALARSADVEKTRRDVGEPRIMRGKKKKEGADVEKQSRKRTKRVTRSLSIATTSIAAQDVEENGGG